MPTVLKVLLVLVGGYIAGAVLGAAATEMFSSNTHDKAVETAMTAIFVAGPLGAIAAVLIASVCGFFRRRTSR